MRRFIVIIGIVVLLAGGCAASQQDIRDTAIELSEQDMRNAETARQVADNFRESWGIWSGAFDTMRTKVSGEAWALKTQLDEVCESEEWGDPARGRMMMLRLLLIKEVGEDTLKESIPGFLDLVGRFL